MGYITIFTERISSHALREEGDRQAFQVQKYYEISIHALREEGDTLCFWAGCALNYFYPRPPRGGRPHSTHTLVFVHKFLSTPSARRATKIRRCSMDILLISIHALREEGDSKNRDKISIFKQIIQHSARI